MTMPDEPDLTAAELALGVLDGEERAAALRRMLAEPAFAREVERWRRHFTALYAEVAAVEPDRALADRVAAIGKNGSNEVRRWRMAAILSGLAATVLLAVLLLRPGQTPVAAPPAARPALLVAVLKPSHGAPVAASFDPATRDMRLHSSVAVAAGRDAELWAIGADGVPHAAGLLSDGRASRFAIGRDVAIAAGTTLAISIEPAGGSPKPTPTGPVIATGVLAAI